MIKSPPPARSPRSGYHSGAHRALVVAFGVCVVSRLGWVCQVLCLLLFSLVPAAAADPDGRPVPTLQANQPMGRPVRVVSICFAPPQPVEKVLKMIDAEANQGADLIVLPETWLGQDDNSRLALESPVVQKVAAMAKRHRTYVLSPLDVVRDGHRFNTALLIDRQGELVGRYDKVFPYWSEYDLKQPVLPGQEAPVFETDFGRIGAAICFDVNFPEVWQQLAERGAELVLWPSAYSAGSHLQAYALLHHYYIVTATYTGDCQVYDITGERILDRSGPGIHVSRVVLDLDRGIYHSNFNDVEGFVRRHAQDVELEKFMPREAWYVVRARRPGVSVRKLGKQFGLEELRDYILRSRTSINKKRP